MFLKLIIDVENNCFKKIQNVFVQIVTFLNNGCVGKVQRVSL